VRKLESRLEQVDEDDRRAAVLRGEDHRLPDRPRTEHDHALTLRDTAAVHGAHRDRHGLHERRDERARVDGEHLLL
jgi:hypothetical protein